MFNFTATMIVEGQWDMAGVEPSEEKFIEAAQHLIDTGLAWQLQGFFGRTCSALIEQGHCSAPGDMEGGEDRLHLREPLGGQYYE